jgi:SpoVK/Ycf46/Vps4 family AAA+-type ATPase
MIEALTSSQRAALDELVEITAAKLAAEHLSYLRVTPRVVPLLTGPTGVGKSFLAKRLARHLGAEFIRVEFESWIPNGASHATPTMRGIELVLREEKPLVVFIDEIDKVTDSRSSWSLGIQAEVWALLDRAVETPRLTVVCAGTWQSEHDRRSPGFVTQEHEIAFGGIPKELRHRFSHAILLRYPTAAETAEIYESSGLNKLAASVGVTLYPDQHNWTGGMRSIERLCTDLLIRRGRNSAAGRERTLALLKKFTSPASRESIDRVLANQHSMN